MIRLPGTQICRRFSYGSLSLGFGDRGTDLGRDSPRDLILDCKHVRQVAVITLSPDMVAHLSIDKLCRNPDPIVFTPYTAFQHVTHTQFVSHLLHNPREGARGWSLELRAMTNRRLFATVR